MIDRFPGGFPVSFMGGIPVKANGRIREGRFASLLRVFRELILPVVSLAVL